VSGGVVRARRMSAFRISTVLLSIAALIGASTSVVAAAPAPAAAVQPAAAPKPADFGPDAAKSADLAVDGYGDAQGYHVTVGREPAGFALQEVALIHPAGFDDGSWTGYQCVSGDGKYAAVAILPASAVNTQAARDHGAFAYSVDLATGAVRALAGGVGLKYYSPGCGTGGTAVFTVALDGQTRLLTANLATGRIDADVTTPGQITSAVPAAGGVVGVAGNRLVSVPGKGKPAVVATLPGDVYDVRPAADGGVSFLHTKPGTRTATAAHEHDGTVTPLGSGDLTRVQLFQGRAGRAVLSGAVPAAPGTLAAAGVRSVGDGALAHGEVALTLGLLRDAPLAFGALAIPSLVLGALVLGAIALGVPFVLGAVHRFAAPLFAAAFLWVTSYRNSWNMLFHTENLLALHLVILAFAPAADAYAWDARRAAPAAPSGAYGWPARAMSAVTVSCYFLAGLAKLKLSGPTWLAGDLLRAQIAYDNLRKIELGSWHSPLGVALVHYRAPFVALALLTVVLELGAPVALVGRRAARAWVALAWSFHVGVAALMAIPFPYQLSLVAYASLFELEKLWDALRLRLRQRAE